MRMESIAIIALLKCIINRCRRDFPHVVDNNSGMPLILNTLADLAFRSLYFSVSFKCRNQVHHIGRLSIYGLIFFVY